MDRKKYDAVIEQLLLDLQKFDSTSKEYKDILNQINMCMNISFEYDKIDAEKEKVQSNNHNEYQKMIINACIGLLGISVGVVSQIWGLSNILNFETTNTFSSKLASPFINLFIKKW